MYASINRDGVRLMRWLMECHMNVCILELFRQPLLDLLHVGSPRTLKSKANKQTSHVCFGLSDLKHFFKV